ncbi:MAG: GGDEF domain-containing protein [Treponema sp.]|jgi:diguanylate cyclase (GGDEF)-like protein|nr:GGDEF domain-containing protein [Treponema sp.]
MEEREYRALDHVLGLLRDDAMPEIPDGLAGIPALREAHRGLGEVREALRSLARGDLPLEISAGGSVAGSLNTLRSRLGELARRMRMAGNGDFSRLGDLGDCPGEIFAAFDSMALGLDAMLCDLRKKEEILLIMTRDLQNEVSLRTSAVEALQQSELRFRHLASHDSLTGILNRRSFMERTSHELQFVGQKSILNCIAIMDIDHFKRFNDSYGHVNGDEVLKHVVKIVSEGLRKHDFLGRYGGEEFVFFLGNADLETGVKVAERLRKALESSPVEIESGPVRITASFGIAPVVNSEIPAQAEDRENTDFIRMVIDRADHAMYKAKRTGRNKVVAYEPGLEMQEHQ